MRNNIYFSNQTSVHLTHPVFLSQDLILLWKVSDIVARHDFHFDANIWEDRCYPQHLLTTVLISSFRQMQHLLIDNTFKLILQHATNRQIPSFKTVKTVGAKGVLPSAADGNLWCRPLPWYCIYMTIDKTHLACLWFYFWNYSCLQSKMHVPVKHSLKQFH